MRILDKREGSHPEMLMGNLQVKKGFGMNAGF